MLRRESDLSDIVMRKLGKDRGEGGQLPSSRKKASQKEDPCGALWKAEVVYLGLKGGGGAGQKRGNVEAEFGSQRKN